VISDASQLPIQYGINLKARPTTSERQKLIQLIELCLQNGRNGIPGLSPDQAAELEEQVFAGTNLSEIRHTMKKWVEKDRQRVQAEKERLIQLQNDGQKQAQTMAGQLAMQLEDKKRQNMITEKDLDTRSQMIVRNFDSMKKIDEIMAQVLAKAGADAANLKLENDLQPQLQENNLIPQAPIAPMPPGQPGQGVQPQMPVPQGP